MELTSLYERGIKMEVADYRQMNTFELIDRINNTVTWDDEENEPCMRELCERYNIDFDNYNDDGSIWDYEVLWDIITHEVYDDVVVHRQYVINDRDFTIVSLESDKYAVYGVVDIVDRNNMFTVYEVGTLRECKNYLKEQIDND